MHVAILTPAYGGNISESYLNSLMALMCSERKFTFARQGLSNESLISRGRCGMATWFYEQTAADAMLWIDADIGFPASGAIRLVESGHDVCAVSYPKKSILWDKARTIAPKTKSAEELEICSVDYVDCVTVPEDLLPGETINPATGTSGFRETQYAGTGFMLVTRAACDRMKEAYPQKALMGDRWCYLWFDTLVHPASHRYLSEDYAFCHKWRAIGGKVMLDTVTPLNHEGSYTFRGKRGGQVEKPKRAKVKRS